MSKYKPLSDHLASRSDAEWRASFSDLEEVLGFPLPKAARSQGAWWANEGDKSHIRAWLDHGWRVAEVDRKAETVAFRKDTAPPEVQPPAMKAAADATVDEIPILKRLDENVPGGKKAVIGGAVAAVLGLGALVARAILRRR